MIRMAPIPLQFPKRPRARRIFGVLSLAVFLSVIGPTNATATRVPAGTPSLGINLAAPADWNTELPFVDVFRLSRTWTGRKINGPRGSCLLKLNDRGWVTRLEPECPAETVMCAIQDGHYPSGRYTVLYDGQGLFEFRGSASLISHQAGLATIAVDAAKGPLLLRLVSMDRENPVRSLRVIMPGFQNDYDRHPFHPAFLERWRGSACFRFMDWMKTNNSDVSRWSQRPTLSDATFTARGVPLEVMVDLCNRQQADAWFCIPHMADDEFVRSMAVLARDSLDRNLKVYVEYSNEVWNDLFSQSLYAKREGERYGLGSRERPRECGARYYARRSVEIFKIWMDVFDSPHRLVRVLAWQAANPEWIERFVLNYRQAYQYADALAIAPYIQMSVSPHGKELNADTVSGWPVESVLDRLEARALPAAVRDMNACKKIAGRYGLRLIAYEGGQHLVGVAGAENNRTLTDLFHQVNAHPRMAAIYRRYLEAWRHAGGDLFCHFSSVSKWSKWGSWGAMEYYDSDPYQSPKMKALMEWITHRRPQTAPPSTPR